MISENSSDAAVLWVQAEPRLRAFVAAAVWDVHHAEDVLQNTATVVLENFHAYDPKRPFLPWAMGIARFKVMDYFRSQSSSHPQFSDLTLANLATVAQDLNDEELVDRRRALKDCVARLKGRQRKVIELRYLDGRSTAEVATKLETSCSTIEVTLHRARSALRNCVGRMGSDIPTMG
ncbi:RNA polymerase sigma-70 factor, ECF subfamily [Neorhodopirellula lusitana]|uniref:RNA polymerase sigma-70 factor, ECF subfamily n=1 Tax=Neorhodopirellula lusitana TaxID=445327 RepID=A0ABY1QRH1_9BACT|nr:sigma-70 family RNA polymerase sigma factor [Neorhodopirellula lusitana]SMP78830.1 RNA polymerase sigma-70 factor, ECF subfamily [Neorhodopirellula lusitana]